MSKIINQAESLKRALRSASVLSNEERHKLETISRNLDILVNEIELAKDPANHMRNIFMRITPKNVAPTHMFGSNVRSQVINEFAIVFAKLEDGIWVPDENRVLAKFALSERSLADAMWSRDTYSGTPINFIEDHGVALPKYVPAVTNDYLEGLNKRFAGHGKLVDSIKSIVSKVEAGELSLNKADASKLIDALLKSSGYLASAESYDLGIVTEKLDRNSSDLRSEILSSVYSSLARITEYAQIEYKEEDGVAYDSPLASYFAVNLDGEIRQLISELIEEDIYSYPQDYPKGKDHNWATNKEGDRVTNKDKNYASNQACLAISNPQGQQSGLFGDERTHLSYISMDFNFAGHEFVSGDTDYFDRVLSMFRIELTKVQLTSLLQGAMVGMWEKATLSRIVNNGVEEDKERIADVKAKRNHSLDKLSAVDEIREDLDTITSMTSNIRSKAGKQELLDAIKSLIVKIEAAAADKRIQIDDKVADIINLYKDDAVEFVGVLDKKAGHLLTDSTRDSIALLLADKSEK